MNGAHIMSIYSIFCFLFSVQCVASFLIYYTLLSTALKTELLTSLWPFLLGSALQFFTTVNASTLTTPKMMFYYYLNFTVGYRQTVGLWHKIFTKFKCSRQDTDPSQHSMCSNHSSPNLLQLQLIKPQNLTSNTKTIRNT